MPCRSPRGVVSKHALQVSRPTPGGGGLRGMARGVSRPTPGGVSTPKPMGGVSQHALRQTPHTDGYYEGQYASYWNAFSFYLDLQYFRLLL